MRESVAFWVAIAFFAVAAGFAGFMDGFSTGKAYAASDAGDSGLQKLDGGLELTTGDPLKKMNPAHVDWRKTVASRRVQLAPKLVEMADRVSKKTGIEWSPGQAHCTSDAFIEEKNPDICIVTFTAQAISPFTLIFVYEDGWKVLETVYN